MLQRAGRIVRAVGEAPGGLRLAELAARVDLPTPTVHRIVHALSEEQFLVINSNGRIEIGSAVTTLAQAAAGGISARLRPLLVRLRLGINETVDLSVLVGQAVRFIDQVPCAHRLQAVSAVGDMLPLHCTANGKAFLASLPRPRTGFWSSRSSATRRTRSSTASS